MEPQTELLAHKEDKTMYELNKIAFGSFLAQLRKEKGMTQKELAAGLYVSDKAVSKNWLHVIVSCMESRRQEHRFRVEPRR